MNFSPRRRWPCAGNITSENRCKTVFIITANDPRPAHPRVPISPTVAQAARFLSPGRQRIRSGLSILYNAHIHGFSRKFDCHTKPAFVLLEISPSTCFNLGVRVKFPSQLYNNIDSWFILFIYFFFKNSHRELLHNTTVILVDGQRPWSLLMGLYYYYFTAVDESV